MFILIPIWGNDQNWLIYFSDGSVQPPIRYYFTPWFAGLFEVFYCKFPLISDTLVIRWPFNREIRDAGQGNPCPQWTTISWANWICMIWIWMIWILQWVPWLVAAFFCVFFVVVVLPRFGVAMFFLFSWKRPMMGWWTFQQRHLRRHFWWSSPTKAMLHTRSISNAMLNLE